MNFLACKKELLIRTIEWTCKKINGILENFGWQISYGIHDFNVAQANIGLQSRMKINRSKIAIVIQGPITNLTLLNKTIKYYRNSFPQALVILSTWENVRNVEQFEIDKLTKIIFSEVPKYAGRQNVFLQMKSTFAGIKEAHNLGFEYVLKTRTDQAILANTGLERIYARWSQFQNGKIERILTSDFNTFIFRPFHINDQMQFFSIKTGLDFWKYDEPELQTVNGSFPIDFPERYLVKRYLEQLGMSSEENIEYHLHSLRDNFVIIDNEELELTWFKGTSRDLRFRFPQKSFPWEWNFCRFSDWIRIQSDLGWYLDAYADLQSKGIQY